MLVALVSTFLHNQHLVVVYTNMMICMSAAGAVSNSDGNLPGRHQEARALES